MAKRRNKNKKAGPVKIIRPADLNPPPVAEMAASEPEVEEQSPSASLFDEGSDSVEATEDGSPVEFSEAEIQAAQEAATETSEPGMAAGDESGESAAPAELSENPEPFEAAESESAMPAEPLPEFEDASALLASSVVVEPQDDVAAHEFESGPIESGSSQSVAGGSAPVDSAVDESMHASDDAPAMASSADATPASQPQAAQRSGGGGKNRKDRKLKLNKQQKQARGDLLSAPQPEAESAPQPEVEFAPQPEAGLATQPEAELAAPPEAESAPQPEAMPEPEPVAEEMPAEPERVGPSEPRIAAFAKLSEYQTLSLAHVAGIPEEADLPGHWRGVGFAISGRRLVTAFDEVVEIIRVPQITHVPGTQAWMLGVANVRGTLLPVVDLKQFLEGERTVMYEGQRVMVVRQSGGNVAVLIDQLYGQRAFNDSQKVDVAADGTTRYGHFIKQLYRVGDNDWGVFSMSMLTRTPEFRQAAA